jgi:hypothetical protein
MESPFPAEIRTTNFDRTRRWLVSVTSAFIVVLGLIVAVIFAEAGLGTRLFEEQTASLVGNVFALFVPPSLSCLKRVPDHLHSQLRPRRRLHPRLYRPPRARPPRPRCNTSNLSQHAFPLPLAKHLHQRHLRVHFISRLRLPFQSSPPFLQRSPRSSSSHEESRFDLLPSLFRPRRP